MYMSDELRRRGITDTYGYNQSGSEMKDYHDTAPKIAARKSNTTFAPKASFRQLQKHREFGGTHGETTASIVSPSGTHVGENRAWDAGSQGSQSKIYKTTTMSTSWDPRKNRRDST